MSEGPELIPAETFAQMMSKMMSPEQLTPERLALIKDMSRSLARDPSFLARIEHLLQDYADQVNRLFPEESELSSFGWPAAKAAAAGASAVAAFAAEDVRGFPG